MNIIFINQDVYYFDYYYYYVKYRSVNDDHKITNNMQKYNGV